ELAVGILQFIRTDFAYITDRMGGQRSVSINALRRLFGADHRVFELMRLNPGDVIRRGQLLNHDGFVLRLVFRVLEAFCEPIAINGEVFRQQIGQLRKFRAFDVFAAQDDVVGRLAGDEFFTFTVENGSASRRDGEYADAISLGLLRKDLAVYHLQIPETPN